MMLRLLAIPLFIIMGLPNKSPDRDKPAEQIVRQIPEVAYDQYCSMGISIFHSGVVARFGLNKTALRPLGDKRLKQHQQNMPPGKSTRETASQSAELVSPITINLYF